MNQNAKKDAKMFKAAAVLYIVLYTDHIYSISAQNEHHFKSVVVYEYNLYRLSPYY